MQMNLFFQKKTYPCDVSFSISDGKNTKKLGNQFDVLSRHLIKEYNINLFEDVTLQLIPYVMSHFTYCSAIWHS